ncbi:MAG: protease HtpX [Oligoflexales bacterium]|nr:protease HtpX [Oligoflexales bacterium]
MTWLRRISFFALVNIGIMLMLSLITNLLGVRPYLTASGIDYSSLMIFCLLWGTGGAFISLWISKWMAKRVYGVQLVDSSSQFAWLVQTVHTLARKAQLEKMPEVGVYESADVNAFATGPSRSNSLVAVSTGLLYKMSREEVEGVLGHEVAHIANGDMVTMTLLQGVLNAFVMFFARIIAHLIDSNLRSDNEGRGSGLGFFGYMMTVFALEMVFGLMAQMVTAYFSRMREYRADKGSAQFGGKDKMVRALEALKRDYPAVENDKHEGRMPALQISSKSKFLQMLSTHPSLDARLRALRGF